MVELSSDVSILLWNERCCNVRDAFAVVYQRWQKTTPININSSSNNNNVNSIIKYSFFHFFFILRFSPSIFFHFCCCSKTRANGNNSLFAPPATHFPRFRFYSGHWEYSRRRKCPKTKQTQIACNISRYEVKALSTQTHTHTPCRDRHPHYIQHIEY